MKQLAFTVDLEDWYHGIPIPTESWKHRQKRLEIGVNHLLECLDGGVHKATFFVLGDAARKHPDLISKVASAGHEIACHGEMHQLVYEQTPTQFRNDIFRSKSFLEDLVGTAIKGYRAPYFSVTDHSLWAFEILRDLGFIYDSSVSPVKTWRYGIEGVPQTPYIEKKTGILEIPVSTLSAYSKNFNLGGAYFRILPFSQFDRHLMAMKNTSPSVFYIHPWEYDPQHPFTRFKWKAMITHYWNLSSTRPKTRKLLTKATSISMGSLAEALLKDPANLPEIHLNPTA